MRNMSVFLFAAAFVVASPALASDSAKPTAAPKEVAATPAKQPVQVQAPYAGNVYSDDMIEPILRAAMEKAVAEYHGWDGYNLTQK